MKIKAPAIFLAVLAVLAGAWLLYGGHQPDLENNITGQRLFPELEQKLNDITRIRVEHNGSVYEVLKERDQWQLPAKGGYPVFFEQVKSLLIGIALLEKVEPKTGKPENYARLGVQEPAAGTNNTRVELFAGGDRPVAALIIGGTRSGLIAGGKDGIYARIPTDPRAWLVAGNLDLPQQQIDWVDRQIIHIKPKAVQRVAIRYPDGETLVLEKRHKGVATYTVANMPKGASLKDHVEINTLARGLAALKMDDVLLRSAAGFPGADTVTAVYETWEGIQVTAYTVEQAGKVFVWFDVRAKIPDVTEGSTRARVQELHSRLEGWIYRIPRARGDKLRKRLDDIILRR